VNADVDPRLASDHDAQVITRVDADAPISQLIAALQADGVVIVENLVDAATLARLNGELDPLLDATPAKRTFLNSALDGFWGDNTRHITGVAAKSRVFTTEVMVNETLLAICDAILLPNCSSYQLNLAHVIDRGPGVAEQYLHRDELVWVHCPTRIRRSSSR
jgi:hypothetical protein